MLNPQISDPTVLLSDSDLLQVQKPAQYLGGELNVVMKTDKEVAIHFALAFPDAYEVGMSHLGLQILYKIINERSDSWAERVFMPLPDMEEKLRRDTKPLFALESKRSLGAFDIVGFSLQYELCTTNILAMLDLSQIPRYAADRNNHHPLIIGGGPYSYHPEPLAPFFDAFFLGDAEEGVHDLIAAVKTWKNSAPSGRESLLTLLAEIEGVYVPSHFSPILAENGSLTEIVPLNPKKTQVVRRLLPTMENAPSVTAPIVPNIRTVHNRLSVEVMRGCVRGCRFCQAGYLYRPQRERSPKEILNIIESALPNTGFEEVSLLSLSTADYCSVVPLLKSVMDRYADGDKLSISFPSTRVDALTPEILEQVQRVRRTGFTVAPEAGTQRLRNVINKGVTDEEILKTAGNVFRMGWKGIKLYFMIGLPTETDQDLDGIIEIARQIKGLPEAKGKDITVSVSTHVPKPHTPFQWAEQITPEETIRRQRYLAAGLDRIRVNFRYHDPFSSLLEGVFARGGRELAPLIERAYEIGARLDAWHEHLREDVWMQAFIDCNINPLFYLRERLPEEVLPWEHLSCDIPKEYFLKEYQRAKRHKETADCLTKSCSICGACNYDTVRNVLFPREETEQLFLQEEHLSPLTNPFSQPALRLRMRYKKSAALRFLGHLELVSVFHRAARRAELPVCYSTGFHPLPRCSFGPPTPLGIGSHSEYLDLFLYEPVETETLKRSLNNTLPSGLEIVEIYKIELNASSIQAALQTQTYRVMWKKQPEGVIGTFLKERELTKNLELLPLNLYQDILVSRSESATKKKQPKRAPHQLAQYLRDIQVNDEAFEFTLLIDGTHSSPRVLDIVSALSGLGLGECVVEKISAEFKSERTTVSITGKLSPLSPALDLGAT